MDDHAVFFGIQFDANAGLAKFRGDGFAPVAFLVLQAVQPGEGRRPFAEGRIGRERREQVGAVGGVESEPLPAAAVHPNAGIRAHQLGSTQEQGAGHGLVRLRGGVAQTVHLEEGVAGQCGDDQLEGAGAPISGYRLVKWQIGLASRHMEPGVVLVAKVDARALHDVHGHVHVGAAHQVLDVNEAVASGGRQGHQESGQELAGESAVQMEFASAQRSLQGHRGMTVLQLDVYPRWSQGVRHHVHRSLPERSVGDEGQGAIVECSNGGEHADAQSALPDFEGVGPRAEAAFETDGVGPHLDFGTEAGSHGERCPAVSRVRRIADPAFAFGQQGRSDEPLHVALGGRRGQPAGEGRGVNDEVHALSTT